MEIIASAAALNDNGGKIVVRHKDEDVTFTFSTFSRDTFDKNAVFLHLNRFWATKPPVFQQTVFNLYRKLSDYFFHINEKEILAIELTNTIAELYALHPFAEMRTWLIYKSGITLPDIAEEFVPDSDRDYTPEKTYTRPDYVDLLTTAFVSQICVPVWSYYLRIIKDDSGSGLKELRSFELLKKTELWNSKPFLKIVAYIAANNKKVVERSGPMGLVHQDDNPFLQMAGFVVRKLSLVELQFRDQRATIVSLLFTFGKTGNAEGNYKDRFKDKNPNAGGSAESDNDGSNKVSVKERHRNSSTLSIEEAAEFRTALGTVEETAAILIPTLPKELLQRSIATSAELLKIENILLTATPSQKTILGWILAPVLSTDGIPYQEPKTIVRYLAFAEAALWYRGFHYLALLMTSRTPQDSNVLHVSSTPFRSRLSDENVKKIRELYPHVRVVQNRKSDPREECSVINSIDNISSDISEYTWLATADESMIIHVQKSNSRRLTIIPDIRNEIARLIISLNTKSFYL